MSRPTSWSIPWGSTQLGYAPRLSCAVWTEWCSDPTSVRCHTGSKSRCRASKRCSRVWLTANGCFGRPATEYSAWVYPIPVSLPPLSYQRQPSRALADRRRQALSCSRRNLEMCNESQTDPGFNVDDPGGADACNAGGENLASLKLHYLTLG